MTQSGALWSASRMAGVQIHANADFDRAVILRGSLGAQSSFALVTSRRRARRFRGESGCRHHVACSAAAVKGAHASSLHCHACTEGASVASSLAAPWHSRLCVSSSGVYFHQFLAMLQIQMVCGHCQSAQTRISCRRCCTPSRCSSGRRALRRAHALMTALRLPGAVTACRESLWCNLCTLCAFEALTFLSWLLLLPDLHGNRWHVSRCFILRPACRSISPTTVCDAALLRREAAC